jgi:uncharacterized protein (DUF302 family)
MTGNDIITKHSQQSVADTVARLHQLLETAGITVFATIDQAEAARQVGLELRDTVLVIFGNPQAGTPLMEAAPLSALDLPLKVLVWDDDGQTSVSYYDPATMGPRYGLSAEQVAALAGIHRLTDAVING